MTPAEAQYSYDAEPINYSTRAPNDPVSAQKKRLDAGTAKLEHDGKHGYLKSVLSALDIDVSSQMLVFSKTSFQLRRIAPWAPRARAPAPPTPARARPPGPPAASPGRCSCSFFFMI